MFIAVMMRVAKPRKNSQVVVGLIVDMHRLGHPSYANLDEDLVRERAKALPEEGVPPEVLKVLPRLDGAQDKLQPQKAATPCDGMEPTLEAGQTFAAQRGRAIVAEGLSRQDANEIAVSALQNMTEEVMTKAEKEAAAAGQTLEIRTGNKFLDQFQPYYFAEAFPFCFKYATACPDVANTTKQQMEEQERQSRRKADAPKVGIEDWAAAMARRVETQFRRDWTFSFTVWNFLFRTMVNLQKNTYMYAVPDSTVKGNKRMLTNKEILDGGKEVAQKLHHGLYTDITGELKPVKGDLSKVPHVPGLSNAARMLLNNLECRARNIPGTHETRKTMRHQTHANRICYGTALFVTFSPSERDTTLMVRLARARQSDPAVLQDGSAKFQSRSKPELDVEYFRLSPEALAEDRGGG